MKYKMLFLNIFIVILIIIQPIISISIDETNNLNIEDEIKRISELNTDVVSNSHKDDTDNSRLELNYREKQILDFSKYGTELGHIVYPRLKKLKKEDEEGYKYFLTFQKCYKTNDGDYKSNGDKIYFTRSKDLKIWDEPSVLFGTEEDIRGFNFDLYDNTNNKTTLSTVLYYSSSDSIVLEDGTIMSISSTYKISSYPIGITYIKSS